MQVKNIQNTGTRLITYVNGSYAVFGIVINGVRYSAWYDEQGSLVDCERYTNKMRTISVPRTATKIRKELNHIGCYWKNEVTA